MFQTLNVCLCPTLVRNESCYDFIRLCCSLGGKVDYNGLGGGVGLDLDLQCKCWASFLFYFFCV